MTDDNSDLKIAEQLANIARKVLLDYSIDPKKIKYKPDSSPVTEADISCESQMRALLSTLAPSDAIWGEELGQAIGERMWVLDPLDGTKAYCSGSPLYCSLIGLIVNNIVQTSVIDFPAIDQRYSTSNNLASKTTQNKTTSLKPINNKVTDLARSRLALTHPYDDKNILSLIKQVGITRYGGDAYNFVLVCEGKLDLAIDKKLQPHDFVALLPLLKATKVVYSDLQGNDLNLNQESDLIVAANKEIHQQVLGIVNA